MTESKNLTQPTTLGDAAVDGLLAGLGAGCGMALYFGLASLVMDGEWWAFIIRFDPGGSALPGMGILTLLAMAGVYGALFGGIIWLTPRPWRRRLRGWPMGLLYVTFLLVLAEIIFFPRLNSAIRSIPLLHMALAHGLYGLLLGWLINVTGTFNR